VFFNLGLTEIPNKITNNQLFSLIVYSVIAMAISQLLFIASIDKIGIAITSLHLNFSPFYVMIILFILGGSWDLRAAIGASIVGGVWDLRAAIGASIVAFGVWLAQSK